MKRLTLGIGVGLVLAALTVGSVTTYLNSEKRAETIVFAQKSMLDKLWETAKADQIEAGSNRTVDRSADNVTTSEGESYTMLRAVWNDDQSTFDKSWTWTKNNLQRPSDSLFSWRYGKLANGSYGVLKEVGGQNTASDADSDIALALIMASQRWHDQSYLNSAEPIIKSIWAQEVIQIDGKPVLVADDVEKANPTNVLVNPSYFSPYAYKVFASVDKTHDWNGLRDNSYAILSAVQTSTLDKSTTDGLIPNWITMNRSTGKISAATGANLDTNYGYDAMRTPFRLALDYAWYNDPRDKQILSKMTFLSDSWKNNGSLASVYSHDSQTVTAAESPAIYGGDIGYFQLTDPTTAKDIYTKKLARLYDTSGEDWKASLNYYDDNWAWFGLALYDHELPNLTNVK